jgi:type I restriction enzyme M protein
MLVKIYFSISFWLKNKSIEDSENLPNPKVTAYYIAKNLEVVFEQFGSIQEDLKTVLRGF